MSFGGWSIDKGLYDFISQNLEDGKIILEFGSGNATEKLARKWKVYSVEENSEWVGKFHDNYIYAPIENQKFDEETEHWGGWYNLKEMKNKLPKKADLILVDGPSHGDRNGIFTNIKIVLKLNPNIFVFDDVNRDDDRLVYQKFIDYFKQNEIEIEHEVIGDEKSFGYIKIK